MAQKSPIVGITGSEALETLNFRHLRYLYHFCLLSTIKRERIRNDRILTYIYLLLTFLFPVLSL